MADFVDEDIVMVCRGEKDSFEFLDSITKWCKLNDIEATFISLHQHHIKFGIEDETQRMIFILRWESSIKR
jgi:hypothetical protein